ncbi:MAG TPA: hypothetical protein VJT49_31020 [Amycolatopsis sp.]|nr:hypothetical protein [Amycolatopsis sp.]HKS49466.1 hypothetical protein [Amycolatopsis sp.]
MDEDYLRKIRHWLRAEHAYSRNVLDGWEGTAETEISPAIPLPRTPLE